MIKKNAPAFSYEAKRKPLPGEERSFNACQRQKQKQTNKRSVRAKIAMHEKLRQRGLQTELSDVRTPITPHSAFSLAMFD